VLSSDAVKLRRERLCSLTMGRRGNAGRCCAGCRTFRIYQNIQSRVGRTKGFDYADITSPTICGALWVTAIAWKRILWSGRERYPAGSTSSLFRVGKEDWAVFIEEKEGASADSKNWPAQWPRGRDISGVQEKEKVISHPDDTISEGIRIKTKK